MVSGELQVANSAASRRHSKLAPASLEKVKVGVSSLVGPAGPPSIAVSGACVSTVHVRLAGDPSVFPAASVARTWKVCSPSASALRTCGLVHEANVPSSSLHSNVAVSFAEKAKVASVARVDTLGPESIVVSGAAVSTVKLRLAASPVFPAASVARTSNVCAPSASTSVVCSDVQAANGAVSTRQSRLAPGSLANANVGVASFVRPAGPPVMATVGATVSTVKLRLAGVASTLPAASVARTSKVCAPSASVTAV